MRSVIARSLERTCSPAARCSSPPPSRGGAQHSQSSKQAGNAEKLATPHENPKRRKRINRVPCVREAFCTGPRVLATSNLLLLRSRDTVFTRWVSCSHLCYLSFLSLSSSGGSCNKLADSLANIHMQRVSALSSTCNTFMCFLVKLLSHTHVSQEIVDIAVLNYKSIHTHTHLHTQLQIHIDPYIPTTWPCNLTSGSC